MTSSFAMALELHRKHGMPVGAEPANLSQDRRRLRLRLLGEEVGELVAAMVGLDPVQTQRLCDDLVKRFLYEESANYCVPRVVLASVAQESVDVHAVVSGTMVEYGLPEDAVAHVVQVANLAKVNDPGAKLRKPPGWRPPDIEAAIEHGLALAGCRP